MNGWIIVDKQIGVTSRQVVTKISKTLNIKKVGHGGTLDPLATGILPIAIGEATKVISFVQNQKKKYTFIIEWGKSTDTDDREGKILEKSEYRPTEEEIRKMLNSFVGNILQKPPIYSAIKINGQRSYKLARKNVQIKHKDRLVKIYDLILKNIISDNSAEFEVKCGKGTYVRSLARDIAEKLNTKGHIISLRRLSVGPFNEKDSIFIDFSKEIIHSPSILCKILPLKTVLDDIPALFLNETETRRVQQGQKIHLNSLQFIKDFEVNHPNYNEFEKICAIKDDNLIALIKIEDGIMRPSRIINF
ncbi:tRNA pseudouridine(55) synthase TruB [Alphaproteobacteria bacterium]|nr:tRNA pseudouridine(55) synthase TruB [Alphaproteobacteria bacterium]